MPCSVPICQCKGTVFLKIWWQVLIICGLSLTISFIHLNVPQWKVTIPMTLVPILGVATGMLLVFRTNTAYDRYWEARKLWSSMTTSIRNLTRNIWVGIKEPEGESSKVLVEKISALNILAAFSYATRNYLREEYSYEDADLKQLLRHVPKFYNMNCKCKKKKPVKDQIEQDMEGVASSMWCVSCYGTKKYTFTAYDEETPTHIPMELSYLLANFIKNANSRNLVDPSLLAAINSALNSLVDCLTGFERVLRTPIPLAYSVHLNHATWIYLLTLPSQLVEALGWWTAFATSLAAFCLLGVLEIGWEIENPFGRDTNDLPLDDFCRVTHREIQKIMGQKLISAETWIMSPKNRPLAPDCSLNALELSKLPLNDVRNLMMRDPYYMRTYFINPTFISDEPVKPSAQENLETSKTESASTASAKSSKSDVSKEDEKKDESDSDDEDVPEAVDIDLNTKRKSATPPDEDDVEKAESAEEEEEEEEEISDAEEDSIEDEQTRKVTVESKKS